MIILAPDYFIHSNIPPHRNNVEIAKWLLEQHVLVRPKCLYCSDVLLSDLSLHCPE